MRDRSELQDLLRRIDGRGYKAYKDLKGATRLDGATVLFVDHVQADPFAAPSKVRVRVDREVPDAWRTDGARCIAVEDWFARRLASAASSDSGGPRGPSIHVDRPGQEVVQRTAVRLHPSGLEFRMAVSLPARGRTILGRQAAELLTDLLPGTVHRASTTSLDEVEQLQRFVETVENQIHLRDQLAARGWVAFVADGSRLPRASGVSDRPLEDAIPFQAPAEQAEHLELRHPEGAKVRGLPFVEGVSLIVGGGYHGKSTLLEALQRSVYDHVPGDGREGVVTRSDAMKIRAEDGRRVEGVDISAFIAGLPSGRPTDAFRSEDASGSTSQAAALAEAIEAGARLLLLDEDTSATNFMIRDARMQALVAKEDEPITPFVARVRDLYERLGVCTLLVMGGSGDYFGHADRVVQMRNFLPLDVTERARALAEPQVRAPDPLVPPNSRRPRAQGLQPSRGRKDHRIDAPRDDEIRYGEWTIDLRALEQTVDRTQLRAIGNLIARSRQWMDGRTLPEVLDALQAWLDAEGLDALGPSPHPGWLSRPRRQEIAAALNRHRGLQVDTAPYDSKDSRDSKPD